MLYIVVSTLYITHSCVITLGLSFNRYFLTEFDWKTKVVTIRQMKSLTKFDKWWMSKCMCIEGILSYLTMALQVD